MEKRIYLSAPHIGAEEIGFVQEAFSSNWIAPVGPNIDAFEAEMCERLGIEGAVALSSGSAGLHLALILLGVGPEDEVFCSTLTFVASANPIRYLGATPVFIDSDRDSWNMDPHLLREALENRRKNGQRLPKAVIVVDLFGQCADYDALLEVCEQYEVALVEDAAEAVGASYKGKPAGTFGAFGVYSFNGNKMITTSGGGMLLSRNVEAIEQARFLSTQARDAAVHYEHSQLGYNYRMSNVLAGIGRGQLRVLEDRVRVRRRNFDYYREFLGDLPGVSFMPEASYGVSTRWLTCIQIDPKVAGVSKDTVLDAMEKENIECRPAWKPLHLQPLYRDALIVGGAVSEDIFACGLCLPSGSGLTDGQLSRVVSVFRSVFCS